MSTDRHFLEKISSGVPYGFHMSTDRHFLKKIFIRGSIWVPYEYRSTFFGKKIFIGGSIWVPYEYRSTFFGKKISSGVPYGFHMSTDRHFLKKNFHQGFHMGSIYVQIDIF